jgi:hypothetical protein
MARRQRQSVGLTSHRNGSILSTYQLGSNSETIRSTIWILYCNGWAVGERARFHEPRIDDMWFS